MSLLINENIEMPTNCRDCPLDEFRCLRNKSDITMRSMERGRHPDCPLVEVHDGHGRLIDADALEADLKRQCNEVFKIDAVSPDDFWIERNKAYNERLWGTWCESFFDYLRTRPTIIPAEEEKK